MKCSIRKSIIAVVILTLFSSISLAGTYSGGDGSAGNPFQISTVAEWEELMATSTDWDRQFILTADIDLAGVTLTPVGNIDVQFKGICDGGGHKISNAVINQPNSDYTGLFGYVSEGGQICNLGIEDVNITGRQYVGGLAGYNDNGTINSCYVTGNVNGYEQVGGLVGMQVLGRIDSCYTTATISGNFIVGGLAGYNNYGLISYCYAAGPVVSQATIGIGGLLGNNVRYSDIVSCFWDIQSSGRNLSPNGGTGKSTLEMQTLSTFTNASWDFSNIDGDAADWQMPQNDYPRLAWEILENTNCWPWKLVSNMMTARDQFAGGVIGDKIYVFGGNGNPDGINLNSGEVYDIASDTWSPIASRTNHGIEELTGVGLNGKFYVFGGYGDIGPRGYYGDINFNEMYDPATNTWTTLAQKPTTVTSSTAAVYNNRIYLFGGAFSDNGPDDYNVNYTTVEAYDPASNTWQYVTDMPVFLFNPSIAVYGDSAYLIGGYDPSTDTFNTEVMAYNFTSNTWTRDYCSLDNSIGMAYSYAAPTPVVNGKAYIVGGGEGTCMADHWVTNRATVFDIAQKKWYSMPNMPEPRSCQLVVMHDNVIYVIGGYAEESNLNDVSTNTVYAYPLPSVDLTGEYWFGSLSADVTTNAPWAKRGTVSITGWNWLQEWDDYNGHHSFSSVFTTTIQTDGSINVNFPGETYNIAWNGDIMIHAGSVLCGGGQGIDLFTRKATNVNFNDILGDYAYFGHHLDSPSPGDSCNWGDFTFNPNGTITATSTNDKGAIETGTMDWTIDDVNAVLTVLGPGVNELGYAESFVSKGGILSSWQIVPEEGRGDLGSALLIRKTKQTIAMSDIAGTYQIRFFETGPGGVPYTCDKGTCVIGTNGVFSVDAYYSDGEHDISSMSCYVGPGNTIHFDDNNTIEGIISPGNNMLFFHEWYDDPAVRKDYDWLGGIFLVRMSD